MNNKKHSTDEKTILHLIDTTGPGGAETVFIQLADRLRNEGYRSLVVIKGKGWVYEQLQAKKLEPIIIPSSGSFAFGYLSGLIKLINNEKVDLIQSHLLGSNVYASIAGLITRKPVVATYHGMVDVDPHERFKFIKQLAMKKGINCYVSVSQRLQNNIKQQGLLDPNKSKVIYNGVDLEQYNLIKSTKLREKLGLNKDTLVIGALGNIRPAKAYDNLINAGAELLKKFPHTHFIVAGHQKEKLMQQLNKQMKTLKVEANFHFIGFCDNTAEYLAELDLFVLSSSSEGFSIATIEAMASGLPVVTTLCGGPEEIITQGKDGQMVPVANPVALSNMLATVMESKELAKELSDKAKATVASRFSLNSMLAGYSNVYQHLIK